MGAELAVSISVYSPQSPTRHPLFALKRKLCIFMAIVLVLILVPISNSYAEKSPTDTINSGTSVVNRDVISFGVLPYLSAAALIKTWRPFADYLEEIIQKKVVIKTAPNFQTFINRTAKGRYDLLMTAPHFAALAIKSNGYQIIAGNTNDLVGDIVIANTARFQSINDLRGKTISTPNALAAVTILAEIKLKQHGLIPGKDIQLKRTASHNAALIDVATGRSAAGVAVGGLYRRLNASNKYPQLKKLATTDQIPHAMYIANASIPRDTVLKIQQALTDSHKSALGHRAMKTIKNNFNVNGISIVSPQKLKRLNRVLSLLVTKINKE